MENILQIWLYFICKKNLKMRKYFLTIFYLQKKSKNEKIFSKKYFSLKKQITVIKSLVHLFICILIISSEC